jgi:hypothetical protein
MYYNITGAECESRSQCRKASLKDAVERLEAIERELHRQFEEIQILKEENRFLRKIVGRDEELLPMDDRLLEQMR